ncbi:hypothetical protein GCM10028799_71620 [Kribbella italica]
MSSNGEEQLASAVLAAPEAASASNRRRDSVGSTELSPLTERCPGWVPADGLPVGRSCDRVGAQSGAIAVWGGAIDRAARTWLGSPAVASPRGGFYELA